MTIDEAITMLRSAGRLTEEQAAAIRADPSVPVEGEALRAWLIAQNYLSDEGPAAVTLSEEPMPLLVVPPGHDDLPFVPEEAVEANPFESSLNDSVPVRRRPPAEPPMSRETMWKWIGVGGGLWALGLLILGLWIGGCFSESPKSRIKSKTGDGKAK